MDQTDLVGEGANPPAASKKGSPDALGGEAGTEEGHGEFPAGPALVSARLDVERDALVLSLQNLTDVSGRLSLDTLIGNPEGLYFTPRAGSAEFGPHEEIELRLSPSDIKGLDLAGNEWTDAQVSYEFHLADDRQDGATVYTFTEYGRVAPLRAVVSSGRSYGFPDVEPPAPAITDKQAQTFTACFSNVVNFDGVNETGIDYLQARVGAVFASGQMISIYQPKDVWFGQRHLDGNGCIALPRVQGEWKFNVYAQSEDYPSPGVTITATLESGAIPKGTVRVTVGQNGNPPRAEVQMHTYVERTLQTALGATLHTLRRVRAFVSGVQPSALKLVLAPEGTLGQYVHETRTIHLPTADARRRRTVAHEVGHWIQNNAVNKDMQKDYSYCTSGDTECTVPPNDGCLRSPGLTGHNLYSVEWSSAAHIEGFATFIAALAYNDLAPGADCRLPDVLGLSISGECEAKGVTLETGQPLPDGSGNAGTCYEWLEPDRPIFGKVGVEGDFTKLYWDFFADEGAQGADLNAYLSAEASVTGWTRTNHVDMILQAIRNQQMKAAFRRAATGNIWPGDAH